jgi:hypothetical protein
VWSQLELVGHADGGAEVRGSYLFLFTVDTLGLGPSAIKLTAVINGLFVIS